MSRLPSRVERLRRVQADPVRIVGGNIGLPAAKDDGVPLAHQEPVAGCRGAPGSITRGELLNPRIVFLPRFTNIVDDAASSRSGSAG